jgi:hypothetical protein
MLAVTVDDVVIIYAMSVVVAILCGGRGEGCGRCSAMGGVICRGMVVLGAVFHGSSFERKLRLLQTGSMREEAGEVSY